MTITGLLERILSLKLGRLGSPTKEVHREKISDNREARKKAAHEEAMKRWHYDLKAIEEAIWKVDLGENIEKVIEELNRDLLLSKPVDIEMFRRLVENRRIHTQSTGKD